MDYTPLLYRPHRLSATFLSLTAVLFLLLLSACPGPKPPSVDPQAALIAKGKDLFFNETFSGNGRTCGTCHRAEDNFALSPTFIATLPDDDPLFVAEFVPALKANFEKPVLMRQFGLILENLDGFDDLPKRFTMRGIPHVLAQRTSVASAAGPRTGWSGDGAPGDGALRQFAVGAVIQHFPKTLNRVAGVDFRLPTADELEAIEAFMLSLGRQEDLRLPLSLKGLVARRGQEIFLDNALGKCNICHANAGANASIGGGNLNFNTGVEDLPDQPARLTGETIPRDDGFGIPGDGTFNTPPVVEAADTGPFFHNNAVETIEGAVAFYNGDAFNNSPAGRFLASRDPNRVGIRLDATQVVEVAAFLRVINALENIRASSKLLLESTARGTIPDTAKEALARAIEETEDGITVLAGGGLHPEAVAHLKAVRHLTRKAHRKHVADRKDVDAALRQLTKARAELIE